MYFDSQKKPFTEFFAPKNIFNYFWADYLKKLTIREINKKNDVTVVGTPQFTLDMTSFVNVP